MKRKIRLTESDLHRIVKESVKRILREGLFPRKNNIGTPNHGHEPWETRPSDGKYKMGDVVKTTEDHLYIPAGSTVKVIDIDSVRGYGIRDVKTGEEVIEIGWII